MASRTRRHPLILLILGDLNRSAGRIDVNKYVAIPDLHWIASQSGGWTVDQSSGRNVESPPMPWACNNFTLQRTLPYRSAPVQAYIADAKQLTVHIGDRDARSADIRFQNSAWRDRCNVRHPHKSHQQPFRRERQRSFILELEASARKECSGHVPRKTSRPPAEFRSLPDYDRRASRHTVPCQRGAPVY